MEKEREDAGLQQGEGAEIVQEVGRLDAAGEARFREGGRKGKIKARREGAEPFKDNHFGTAQGEQARCEQFREVQESEVRLTFSFFEAASNKSLVFF